MKRKIKIKILFFISIVFTQVLYAAECSTCHTSNKNNLDLIKNWEELLKNDHQKLKDAHKSDELKDVMNYLNSKEFEKKAPKLLFGIDTFEEK